MITAKILVAIALVLTVSSASMAFGKALTLSATPQDIAATNLENVAAPTASVGQVTWTEGIDAAGNIVVDTATIPVTNTDTGSHDYRVCGALKGTDSTVTSLVCVNLAGVAASATGTANLDFSSIDFGVENLDVISVSVKETA